MKLGKTVACRVVILADSDANCSVVERALHQACARGKFQVERLSAPLSQSSFSAREHTAIIFTRSEIEKLSFESVAVIRSLTQSASCRIFVVDINDGQPSNALTPLYDLIQRSRTSHPNEIASLVIEFFQEANLLWRTSNLMGIRDAFCICSYRIFAVFWPFSYIFSAALVIHAVAALVWESPLPWQFIVDNAVIVTVMIFFGWFFCVHALLTLTKNYLFASRIVGTIDRSFYALGAILFLAAAAVICSICTLGQPMVLTLLALALAGAFHWAYMFVRRIRAECTSLSQLQAAMADPSKREKVVQGIGRQPFSQNSFSIFDRPAPRSIFISYMHKSEWSTNAAMQLHREWMQRGAKVFLDRSKIPSGSPWRQHLLRAISECAHFVAILDHKTSESDWVLAESAYAAMLRKNIGKPKILLVVRDVDGTKAIQSSSFGLIYQDIFHIPQPMNYGARIFAAGVAQDSPISAELLDRVLNCIKPMSLLGNQNRVSLWKKYVIARNLSRLLKSCGSLERTLLGEAKQAHDTLVQMGVAALPELRAKNQRLIVEHLAYSKRLKAGESPNPLENYSFKSDKEKRYRYVIQLKQMRVVDLIEEIERANGSE